MTSPAKVYLRVLFACRSDLDMDGGVARVMRQTADALNGKGIDVEISHDLYPAAKDFDVVHVFDSSKPRTALAQLKNLRHGGAPVVWSPFYFDRRELAWAGTAIDYIFGRDNTPEKKRELLVALSTGSLDVKDFTGLTDDTRPELDQALREMLSCVDHVCASSYHEIQALSRSVELPEIPFTITPHGVDAGWLAGASAGLFTSKYGLKDFILCVGPVERRKNQIMLIEALKDTGLQMVLIGPAPEQDYLDLCLREGGKRVTWTGKLDRDLIVSAYRGAAAHVLPSFSECAALSNLDAAVSECPIVVSNRSSEFEYFGDAPLYCNPAGAESIRNSVMQALDSSWTRRNRWKKLSREVQERFTWGRTAELAIKAYERVLGAGYSRKKKPAMPAKSDS